MICCPVPVLAFFASTYSPDSPVFLISQGQDEKAQNAIRKLYGSNYDSLTEINLIKVDLQKQKFNIAEKSGRKSLIETFKRPEVYKPFMIILLMGILQQFSGMTVIRGYVVKIFNEIFQKNDNKVIDGELNDCTHVAKEAYLAAIIIGIMRLISSLLLSKLIYHFKRRHMYFLSGKILFTHSGTYLNIITTQVSNFESKCYILN